MTDYFDKLNDKQAEAVRYTEGPLLILAGAGSGKTRVLTHRIAYLIGEKQVAPYNIMAITFTNKAAGEMRERVNNIVGEGADQIWVSTFHSACVRILRRYIDLIGYDNDFTIYDTDDQKKLMKNIIKARNLDTKKYPERVQLSKISDFKNKLATPYDVELLAASDFRMKEIAAIYDEYQGQLKKNNALDFDDLIMMTVKLFSECPNVLEYYQSRLKYVMVDEYQDTNKAQFELVRLLSGKYRNLCVVGDDDQSIYKFRGADISNILEFEKHFPDAKVIKLEQNYRSTKRILEAANAVIGNNFGRKDKSLWCENSEGSRIDLYQAEDAYDEAQMIARSIAQSVREGRADYSDFAILYRTNAQSRAIEEKLLFANIPYKIIGGQNFYQRREIKDIIAYLRIISSSSDDISVMRVINVPKRGIGATTLDKAVMMAQNSGYSLYDILLDADDIPEFKRSASKIKIFTELIEQLREQSKELSLKELAEKVIEETEYIEALQREEGEEAATRVDNINELISKIAEYEEQTDEPTLTGFLEEVALVADIDSLDNENNYVVLMTIHSAKGLEFPNVFLTGMEEGLFPGFASIDDEEELEEERRLCYVAITRAMDNLTISYAKRRMVRGETMYNLVSRFVKEIPPLIVNSKNITDTAAAGMKGGYGSAYSGKNGYRSSGFNSFGSSSYSDSSYGSSYGNSYGSSYGGGYSSPKKTASKPAYSTSANPGFGKAFSVTKAEIDYAVGDRVKHIKFGEGIVKEIEDGPKDYQVTVDFDKAGTKVMMASFAKLKKV